MNALLTAILAIVTALTFAVGNVESSTSLDGGGVESTVTIDLSQ